MGNKLSVGLNVVLLAAVVWLFIDRYSGGDEPVVNPDVQVTDTSSNTPDNQVIYSDDSIDTAEVQIVVPDAAAVIAYVNSDSVSMNYEYIIDKSAELLEKQRNFEAKISRRIKQLEADYLAAQGDPEILADQAKAQRVFQKLQEEEASIQRYQERESQAIMMAQAEAQSEMYSQIQTLITGYCEEHGIDYVMGYSNEQPIVIHANPEYEITDIVIYKLNKEYRARQAAGNPTP